MTGLHESAPRPQVAVLFGALLGGEPGGDETLDELAGLAEAADVSVGGRLIQRLDRPVPATYLGSGKVQELKELMGRESADVALADMDLSPAQARNLTKALGRRVVDRSELIMDIFAVRARTAQAKLQVELAQLKYALPRLRGQWAHLDRYKGGGVGTRGPGEKQIETDRRLVNKRIRDLEERLGVFERRTQRTMAGRRNARKVALAGYTNTGKSTLFNTLTGAGVLAANRLFATLDTRTRQWPMDDCEGVILSDTVGFVKKLPHHLVASFHATLEEVVEADLILHVVDASAPQVRDRIAAVRETMASIGAGEVPTTVVFNKVDLVRDHMELNALLNAVPGAVVVSARTGAGLDDLAAAVADQFRGRTHEFELSLELSDGRALARAGELGSVLGTRVDDERLVVHLRVQDWQLGRLRGWVESAGLPLESVDGLASS